MRPRCRAATRNSSTNRKRPSNEILLMRATTKIEALDLYVWEGKADIVDRVARCMASFEVEVIRADDVAISLERTSARPSLALISVSVIDTAGFAVRDLQATHGMPVIWVGAAPRDHD